MSAIEILKEMIGDYELLGLTAGINNKKKLYDADVKRINALKKALLALEQIDNIKLDLKLIIQNINEDNYVNLKQDVLDDLKEVLGGLK